ncbi:hypothetical protein [Pectobacterium brasiliense]|uniref:hypothetical protein n=1 Tax=Pectobacterium brasiliense TaxID=180957 RepID=UPI0039863220
MKYTPSRTALDIDELLMRLPDEDRAMVDDGVKWIFKLSTIDSKLVDAINLAGLASQKECSDFVSTDEYQELAGNFIVDLAYLFTVHRMKKQSAAFFDDIGLDEFDNRRLM